MTATIYSTTTAAARNTPVVKPIISIVPGRCKSLSWIDYKLGDVIVSVDADNGRPALIEGGNNIQALYAVLSHPDVCEAMGTPAPVRALPLAESRYNVEEGYWELWWGGSHVGTVDSEEEAIDLLGEMLDEVAQH